MVNDFVGGDDYTIRELYHMHTVWPIAYLGGAMIVNVEISMVNTS